MRAIRNSVLSAAAVLCCSSLLEAQDRFGSGTRGGTMSPSITYSQVHGESGEGLQRVSWLRAVILWRGQPGWGNRELGDTVRSNLAMQTYNSRQRAAEDARRPFTGGIQGGYVYSAEIDRDWRWIQLLDRRYEMPRTDSAIVLLVDRIDSVGGPPVVAGIAYIDSRMPDAFWDKWWQSGDTTFSVRSRNHPSLLDAALRSSPVVRDFLR